MALGLKDIHMEQIAHCDIKHKNILLNNKGMTPKVKIADFGLACHLNDDECFKHESGTLGYKAPEMINKQPGDFRSDVWSLGIITYELLCGEMPFTGSSTEQVEERILTLKPSFKGRIWSRVSD